MPNTGRPSKACSTCKQRKVKCSETHPVCRRCARLNLSCEWEEISVFRHQEHWAERLVVSRVRQAQAVRGDEVATPAARIPASLMRRQLAFDLQDSALQRFYNDYAYTSGTSPFLYLIAPLYAQASTPACLHNAVNAMALAAMAKQLRRQEIMESAVMSYGKAVRKLAEGLQHEEAAQHDGTLIAIFLLGLYEIVLYESYHREPSRKCMHSQGRLAVLRLRGPKQLQTKSGRNLFTLLYHQQLIASFMYGGGIMEEYPTWMNHLYPKTPVASMETMMHQASSLKIGMRAAMDAEDTDMLAQLFLDASQLEETLDRTNREIPPTWPYPENIISRIAGTDRPADLPHSLSEQDLIDLPEHLPHYRDITQALVANISGAIRIQILQGIKEAIPSLRRSRVALEMNLDIVEEQSSYKMEQASIGICDNIQLAVGDAAEISTDPQIYGRAFRAWSQLWPMQCALSVDSLPVKVLELLLEKLEYIRRVVGITMATEELVTSG